MVKVTNLTREDLSFNTVGKPDKDGNPPTASIPAGGSADEDFDTENARFKGYVLSGAIDAGAAGKKAAGVVEQPAPTTRPSK